MRNLEIFYLRVEGIQRGPYTIAHIDHLLNCGLITADTLFWREGLEEWQPVTQLVGIKREAKKKWRKWIIPSLIALFLLLVAQCFGPITRDAWRELTSRSFTAEDAYWSARGVVRSQFSRGKPIEFPSLEKSSIALNAADRSAAIQLRITLLDSGNAIQVWDVPMKYEGKVSGWQQKSPPTQISE